MDVLEEFADTMPYRVGGLQGINKAIDSKNIATCVYSSGLQVSGVFSEVLTFGDQPIYVRTTGPSTLALANKQLDAHGKQRHADGFGSPIGRWKAGELREGATVKLKFDSSITVNGK